MAVPRTNKQKQNTNGETRWLWIVAAVFVCIAVIALLYFVDYSDVFSAFSGPTVGYQRPSDPVVTTPAPAVLDKVAYDEKLQEIANYPAPVGTTTATTTKKRLWPVQTIYPNVGALLPFNRIVAYYGNFYSTGMGILGEYPPQEVLQKLASTTAMWQAADPSTPVIPAIDYIAVTAQASAGSDGMYRARMPASQIQQAIDMADQVHGIVFLDVQVGLSNVQTEVPLLAAYLKLPNVELSLDPEFAMQTSGRPPGTVIGTLDAKDINFAANYLANIVTANNLPPKILVVHRFTEDMVTHYKQITPLPQVQIVMDMDGWGFPAKKVNTYNSVIAPEPVQFTGFKLFYKADLQAPANRLMIPAEVLKLIPQPSYIQYQ